MTAKHSPATPLPWRLHMVDGISGPPPQNKVVLPEQCAYHGDAAFIVHAANSYPRAIELLQYCADHAGIGNPLRGSIQEFLRSIGEAE